MSELNRVRWRCRRGMLELDLVLACFVDRHYIQLTPEQRERFGDLLILPDNELWDMLSRDEMTAAVGEMAFVLRLLRRC
jgi:antitoxin CptB